jgi:outer membrane protein OmpA-like peptidoglycan-associated protein/tetratricopeptide (TPR) repeat protein
MKSQHSTFHIYNLISKFSNNGKPLKKLVVVLLMVISAFSFAQSKKLWMLTAENAYKAKDWATAAVYYAKVLDDTTVLETFVLPYEAQMVNLKLKSLVKVPELQLRKPKKDSTQVKKDSSQVAHVDTSRKKKPTPKFNPITSIDYVYWKLAHSYRLNADYNNAVKIYKTCVERNAYPDARYYYGLSLMSLKRYNEALVVFDEYVTHSPENDSLMRIAEKKESSCYFALDTMSNVKREVRVKMLDTLVFNKGTANFAPQYYLSPNKIIFTSARRYGVVNDPEKQDSKYLCDLYYTEMIDSIWQRPVNFGRPVNSVLHEGAGYVTPDEVMLFTRWSDVNRDEVFIFMAKMTDGKFFQAFKLGENVNLPKKKSMHPFVNFNGTRLFYSSNRPGGFGGFDIWVCVIDDEGLIGPPKNLGPQINTAGDEMSPFYHNVSNTLFFASNGLPGMGGLDIFKASFNVDDSVYTFPKNMGAPFNSSKDDAYFIMERTQQRGFFASDREPCEGGHCYDIYEFQNAPIFFDISGYVFDAITNDPIPGALVTVTDVHGDDEPLYLVTDEKGFYSSPLKANREFFLKAQKTKYLADKGSRVTKGLTETTHLEWDAFLSIIPEGEVEIEGIEYDFDKATLRPKSKENLDKIVDLLNLNDNLSVAINAHTDARGNDAYNQRLSQARAQSCVDYLISKGIKKDRLMAKGWGETQPIIPEAEINKMVPKSPEFEAAHQKNRRTAFKVVGESDLKIINKTK